LAGGRSRSSASAARVRTPGSIYDGDGSLALDFDFVHANGDLGYSIGVGYVNDGLALGFSYTNVGDYYDDYYPGYGGGYPAYGCGYSYGGWYPNYYHCYPSYYGGGYYGSCWYPYQPICWRPYAYYWPWYYPYYGCSVVSADLYPAAYGSAAIYGGGFGISAGYASGGYASAGYSTMVEGQEVVVPVSGTYADPTYADAVPVPPRTTTLVDLAGTTSRPYVESGVAAMRQGDYAQAREEFSAAILADAADPAARLGYSISFFAGGHYRAATRGLRRAAALDPALLDSQLDVIGLFPDPDEFHSRLQTLRLHLKDQPQDLDGWLIAAWLELQAGQPESALDAASRAIGLAPQDPLAELLLVAIESGSNQPAGHGYAPEVIEGSFLD
jgi:tetratricopeptide (TPR) repeat protein